MTRSTLLFLALIGTLTVGGIAHAQTPTPPSEGEDRKTPVPHATATPAACKALFTSGRQLPDSFYETTPKGTENYGKKIGCRTKEMSLVKTDSIPIFWVIAGDDWKKDAGNDPAKDKRDAATKWYERYCITLDYKELAIDPADTKKLISFLHKSDDGADDYTDAIWQSYYGSGEDFRPDEGVKDGTLYKQLKRQGIKLGDKYRAADKFLLVMFVDKYKGVHAGERGGQQTDSVSLNFMNIPVILISSADLKSKHILTHELTHGLGKKLKGKTSEAWVTGEQYTWDHVNCEHNMDNGQRSDPKAALSNTDDDPVDWAAYWEWFYGAKNLRLKP